MGALLFSGAFFIVVAVLLMRGGRRRLRSAVEVDHHVVASDRDIDFVVNKVKCVCGRWPDRDGEGPRRHNGGEAWGVELSCVCGRRRSLVFVVGN